MRQLTEAEVHEVSGGMFSGLNLNINYGNVTVGLAMLGLGVAIVSSAGLAAVPIMALGSSGALVGGTGVALAGAGGYMAGSGLTTGFSGEGGGSD